MKKKKKSYFLLLLEEIVRGVALRRDLRGVVGCGAKVLGLADEVVLDLPNGSLVATARYGL